MDQVEGTRAGDGRASDGRDWRDVRDEMGPVKLNGHGSLGINGRAKGPGQGVAPERVYLRPDQITPEGPGQVAFARSLQVNRITYGLGVAGSGKTLLAVRDAVAKFQSGKVTTITLIRPALELGSTLGYQPGDTDAKISGYMTPMMVELGKFYGPADIKRMKADGVLRTLAVQFLRGYNLEDSAVIFDEGQNATHKELQTFLQRLCKGSTFAILGDISRNAPDHPDGPIVKQSDLPAGEQGALEYYAGKFAHLAGIDRVEMTAVDCHRDPLVKAMLEDGL